MNSEITYVTWSFGSDAVRVPVLDVTNPNFSLEDTAASRAALDAAYLEHEQRQSKRPRWITNLMLKAGARQSRFLQALVNPSTNYFDGVTTYLCKLGPDNLPPGFNTKLDQKVAATPHVLSMRLRLQQCVYLLVDALAATLGQSPASPLDLFNIAGGTAIDSLNALIVLRQRNPALLKRPIRIFVMDIDSVGPSFGALATTALTRPDIHCRDSMLSFSTRRMTGMTLHRLPSRLRDPHTTRRSSRFRARVACLNTETIRRLLRI